MRTEELDVGTIVSELQLLVGEGRIHANDLAAWSGDGTELRSLPQVVVEPRSTEEVAAAVRVAAAHGMSITTRGAGSGLAGGAVPHTGGMVISLAKMNRIIEIDGPAMTATVEAGVITGHLQAAVEQQGLFYPPDPASLEICSIGGNIACNAGGPRAVKYGVTRQYVLGLTVVMASGAIVRLGSKTHKQASGYSLQQLFIGSEGTLGIVTEAILRLIPRPPAQATMTVLFSSVHAAGDAVTAVLHGGTLPCTIELMDQTTLETIEAYSHIGLPQSAGAMLIIEVDGDDATAVSRSLDRVQTICSGHGGFAIAVATEGPERAILWGARRDVHFALLQRAPNRKSPDIVVPRSDIPALIDRIRAIEAETGMQIAVFGHAGDGNLHPAVLFDAREDGQANRAAVAEEAIIRAALDLGGMVSGEHGIGILKRRYLELGVGADVVNLMEQVKGTFDPTCLLNPGKVLETSTSLYRIPSAP
ncbi:MAG: hypothetical protein NVS4B8_07540 [Herpetosiphon sp.]